jgi:RNA polymerase sigma-70 factor, ECF subfamily
MDHHPDDDAALVTRVLAGDPDAFAPLLAAHRTSVVGLCRRLLGTTLEAEDIAQEAALRALLSLARLRDPASFGAWLHGIAANLARRELRQRARTRSLEALGHEEGLRAGWPPLTPSAEDTYLLSEVHEQVVAALADLPVATRETVVGFYLGGHSYAELAALAQVPVSTIRGRLFQGRQQLRRTLGPPAAGDRTPQPHPPKEPTMPTPELVEVAVEVRGWCMPFSAPTGQWRPGPTDRRLVALREPATGRELGLLLAGIEAETIDQAQADSQAPQPPTPALTLRLLAPLGAWLEQVAVYRLAEDAFYATITVAHGDHRYQVDARPGDALALAAAGGAPVRLPRAVFDALAWDPNDREQWRLRAAHERRAVADRLASRGPAAATPATPSQALDSEIASQVNTCLRRLRADLGARTVVLMHQRDALVAWQGIGSHQTLARYSAAKANGDEDLTRFYGLEVYPWDEVMGGIAFADVASHWRLEIALPAETPPEQQEPQQARIDQAVSELASLLAPRRSSDLPEPSRSDRTGL